MLFPNFAFTGFTWRYVNPYAKYKRLSEPKITIQEYLDRFMVRAYLEPLSSAIEELEIAWQICQYQSNRDLKSANDFMANKLEEHPMLSSQDNHIDFHYYSELLYNLLKRIENILEEKNGKPDSLSVYYFLIMSIKHFNEDVVYLQSELCNRPGARELPRFDIFPLLIEKAKPQP